MAIENDIPLFSTISGASAAVNGIDALRRGEISISPLQNYYVEQEV